MEWCKRHTFHLESKFGNRFVYCKTEIVKYNNRLCLKVNPAYTVVKQIKAAPEQRNLNADGQSIASDNSSAASDTGDSTINTSTDSDLVDELVEPQCINII